jgi:hypothetical protein
MRHSEMLLTNLKFEIYFTLLLDRLRIKVGIVLFWECQPTEVPVRPRCKGKSSVLVFPW